MTDLGKIDADFFERVVAPNLGADREEVTLGPTAGIDFGVLELGGRAAVVATDPLSVLPALGRERAGRLAVDIVLSDVAVSGVAPGHLTLSLTLPPDYDVDELTAVWRGIDAHASELGVEVTATHVGRYPGVDSSWIGSGTAVGVGDPDDLVRPDGAQPGDAIVMSTGPAAEVAGLFATLYPERLGIDPEAVAIAQERVADVPAVADALAAHRAGAVTAMHDATEGGIAGGLNEMADGAGVRFEIDSAAVPMADGVEAVCDAIDVDPWHVTSCGTLLIAAERGDAADVVAALEKRGTPAAIVGRVRDGSGVYADGHRVEPPATDPSWKAAERLSQS
ncbi:AIR synthase family protein [Halapricum hydrolyticum]|uniref:AIR synthase family protein n=1 Tax=Halapricum hydrolyticum TaxID=2979991 RepID=A0AAE3LJ08_9EURY|nr:AIR synthase family protein [Halapricum hydrolyticum]MCU4719553.1 AIR synthase family protein [Halapricum hydrolyticum]MCU4728504.1 AIR synthase family protein [Halapricum hydrolyticum]